MIVYSSLPSGSVIYCDDIREEKTNKTTLIGIYGADMMIYATPPITLPRLCVYITLQFDPSKIPESAQLGIARKFDNGEEETLLGIELPLQESAAPLLLPDEAESPDSRTHLELRIGHRLDVIDFQSDCRISTFFRIGDDEHRLGSLKVRFAPPRPSTPED